jgi:hypothetical protein
MYPELLQLDAHNLVEFFYKTLLEVKIDLRKVAVGPPYPGAILTRICSKHLQPNVSRPLLWQKMAYFNVAQERQVSVIKSTALRITEVR